MTTKILRAKLLSLFNNLKNRALEYSEDVNYIVWYGVACSCISEWGWRAQE